MWWVGIYNAIHLLWKYPTRWWHTHKRGRYDACFRRFHQQKSGATNDEQNCVNNCRQQKDSMRCAGYLIMFLWIIEKWQCKRNSYFIWKTKNTKPQKMLLCWIEVSISRQEVVISSFEVVSIFTCGNVSTYLKIGWRSCFSVSCFCFLKYYLCYCRVCSIIIFLKLSPNKR